MRKRKAEIALVWEGLVRAEVPDLAALDRAALVDHLPGERTALVHVDLGELCEQALDGRRIAVERSGDLSGMWDPESIKEVLANALANASGVTVREASDHQAVVVRAAGARVAKLPDRVLDHVLAHGGRVAVQGDALEIVLPRTPFAEAPQRT